MFTLRAMSEEDYSEVISRLDSLDADLGYLLNNSNDEEKVLKVYKEMRESWGMLNRLLNE